MRSEILGLFLNTLTGNDKYYFRNSEYLPQSIQIQLPKEQKTFLYFLLYFSNLHQILNILNSLFIFEINECKMRGQINV